MNPKNPYEEFNISVQELKDAFKEAFRPIVFWLLDRIIDMLQWLADKFKK